MRPYSDTALGDRSNAPMPADRQAQLPWLIAGQMLVTPFPPRPVGLTAREAEMIETMGIRLEHDRRAGLLPDCVAFWFSSGDGRCTPLTATRAWLQVTAWQHVVVDLHLLQAMGRVVPVTLLTRRIPPVPMPIPAATRGRPKKEQVEAVIAA